MKYVLQLHSSKNISGKLNKRIVQIWGLERIDSGLLDELTILAEVYTYLKSPHNGGCFLGSKDIISEINTVILDLISINQSTSSHFPVIMAMKLKGYKSSEILTVLKLIEIIFVRNYCIFGIENKELSNLYNKLSYEIYQSKVNYRDIEKRLRDKILEFSDIDFEEKVKTHTFPEKLAKYMLRKIENHISGNRIQEKHVLNTITLEHIMPKDNSIWNVSENDHKQNLNKLGNLTIVHGKINSTIKNNTFDEKKKHYLDSQISLTRDLILEPKWTKVEISQRQKKLARIAVEIWKV